MIFCKINYNIIWNNLQMKNSGPAGQAQALEIDAMENFLLRMTQGHNKQNTERHIFSKIEYIKM